MKWEYKVIQFKYKGLFSTQIEADSVQDELNQLGVEGWELVEFTFNSRNLSNDVGAIAILKRPK